jgi:hypothetical protein
MITISQPPNEIHPVQTVGLRSMYLLLPAGCLRPTRLLAPRFAAAPVKPA